MAAMFVCLISRRGLATGTGIISSSRVLSNRLRRILSLVPEGVGSVADVGCDHGLVSRALSARPQAGRVFAIDRSLAALQAATAEQQWSKPSPSPKFVHGDGLTPLLSSVGKEGQEGYDEEGIHTVICAGMGCSTIIDILESSILEKLRVKRLVLQPWPGYLLPLSALSEHVRALGFSYEKQHIDLEGSIFYVSTSWIKSAPQETPALRVDEVESFRKSPLYQRFGRSGAPNPTSEDEKTEERLWKQYLRQQREDLEVRLRQPLQSRIRGGQDVVKSFHELCTELTM